MLLMKKIVKLEIIVIIIQVNKKLKKKKNEKREAKLTIKPYLTN